MADLDGRKAHEQAQRRAWLSLSYRQRLDWLWQAKLFAARALGAARPNNEHPERTSGLTDRKDDPILAEPPRPARSRS
jgi:hypothetical protein